MMRQRSHISNLIPSLRRLGGTPKRVWSGLGAGASVAILAGIFGMQGGSIDPAHAMQYAFAKPGIVVLEEESGIDAEALELTVVDRGVASFYGSEFEGRPTANGEIFDPTEMTAAHPSLPFGTQIQVTNRRNGKSVIVRVNDRGPFTGGRVIDLSKAAAREIGMVNSGTAPVVVEVITESSE